MKYKFIKLNIALFLPILVVSLLFGSTAKALTFNQNHIIDDGVFDNIYAMNTTSINNFLNQFPSSCISTNNGFTSPDPTGYSPSTGFTYGGNVSGGQVINDAALAYGINPQVLLSTLQKESSVVSGDASYHCQYINTAMGYGCPDSGSCPTNPATESGFSKQVIHAAWLFKFGEQRSEGNISFDVHMDNFPQSGDHWDNSDDPQTCYGGPMTQGTFQVCPNGSSTYYDGYTTIDGTSVHMDTGSTATLYWYTPHFSGNQNFFNIFTNWFGYPYSNANDYSFVTSSATSLHYNPGNTGTATVVIKNTGYNTWYSDHNLPAGQQATRLATVGYQNSPFINPDSNSLFTRNQVLMTPDVVAPGQNATFTFDVTGPYQTLTWNNYLVPEVGGVFLKNLGIDVQLNADTPGWQLTNSTLDTQTPLPNQQSLATFTVQNTSGGTWYSDHNLPAGQQPTHLATIGYQDSPFADTSDPRWLGTRNQITMTPDVVAPGQTATFQAYFIGPISASAITSNFHFFVEVGGVFTQDKGCSFTMSTPAANMSYQFQGSGALPTVMTPGSSATATVTLLNTGNVVWQDENFDAGSHALRLMMNHPNYRNSSFYDSSDPNWLAPSQIAKPTGTVFPGQSTTFTFTWLAPSQTGTYYDSFAPIIGGNFMHDNGLAFNTKVSN